MSAHYRTTINLVHPEAAEIANNTKDFPVPARPQGQSDLIFSQQIRSLIQELDEEATDVRDFISQLSDASDRWMTLRTSMTGNERTQDNTSYDEFIAATPFPQTLNNLKRYDRSLRTQRRKLETAIPQNNPTNTNNTNSPNSSVIHLPKTELPKFSGNCIEYQSFWNSFKSCVHDLPLSDSIKFTYLKQCLTGTPLTLISPLPISDKSYGDALSLLTKSYDNPEDVARSLHNSLRKLPRIRGGEYFCPDLRTLLDQVEFICVQMKQQNLSYDTTSFQMEIEQHLPRFVLEEVFKAKEEDVNWSTDDLKDRLRNILRRREQIDSVQPKQMPMRQSPFKSPAPPDHRFNEPQEASFPTLTFHAQRDRPHSNSKHKVIPKLPCLFCDDPSHFSAYCPKFTDVTSRSERLRALKRCFKCLKAGHFANQCTQPSTCSACKGPHPRALCTQLKGKFSSTFCTQTFTPNSNAFYGNNNRTFQSPTVNGQFNTNFIPSSPLTTGLQNSTVNQSSNQNVSAISASLPSDADPFASSIVPQTNTALSNLQNSLMPILLKCVEVSIFNPENPVKSIIGIGLLDDASTHTYIDLHKAEFLNLSLASSTINLGVFNTTECKSVPAYTTKFGLKFVDGRSIIVTANAIHPLTRPTLYLPYSPALLSYSEVLPKFHLTTPIILLGADYYYEMEPTLIQRLPSGYHLIQTLLGPIIAGKSKISDQGSNVNFTNFCLQTQNEGTIPSDFFTLEGIGIKDSPEQSQAETHVLQSFNKSIELIDNRYQVKLPFKADPTNLPLSSNFGLCWGRLRSVHNQLVKDDSLLSKYNSIIQEQTKMGIIEPVEKPFNFFPPLHYLAHHPVINPEKGKLRIVYDGSAKVGKELSLNECLHPGPVILPDMIGLLFRFRIPKIAIICDIEKAFLQVSVHPSHRDCTRFLWLRNPKLPLSNSNLQIFRFTRVSFGLTCSPFLLAATINYHLTNSSSPMSQEILSNIYVDNLLLCCDDPKNGKDKISNVITLFESASMPIREFTSNSSESIAHLPKERILMGVNHKFLGLQWNTNNDTISFSPSPLPANFSYTKRSILSYIASQYDPLGLISPVILPLKSFLQSICIEPLEWDQLIPQNSQKEWDDILKNWNHTDEIKIPRNPITFPNLNSVFELHCFTDASIFAMCAAVFLRVSNPLSNLSECFLIFAKTKVKPKHKGTNLTIPKLELIAAQMGAKLLKFTHSHLTNLTFTPTLNLWCDSAIVISWLNNDSYNREIFVCNRLKTIQSLPNLIVRHLPGTQNPADIGSRGVPSIHALNELKIWWTGPEWLTQPPNLWPYNKEIKPYISNSCKIPKIISPPPIFTLIVEKLVPNPTIEISRFSRLPKLLRSVAYFLRFVSHLKAKFRKIAYKSTSIVITVSELRCAFHFLLKQEQSSHPPNEHEKEALGLFSDDSGIIKSKGRIKYSKLNN